MEKVYMTIFLMGISKNDEHLQRALIEKWKGEGLGDKQKPKSASSWVKTRRFDRVPLQISSIGTLH